jgi:hypothetical protein
MRLVPIKYEFINIKFIERDKVNFLKIKICKNGGGKK